MVRLLLDAQQVVDGMTLRDLIQFVPSITGTLALLVFAWLTFQRKIIMRGELDDARAIHKTAMEDAEERRLADVATANARALEIKAERDEWKTFSYRQLNVNERSLSVVGESQSITASQIKGTGA